MVQSRVRAGGANRVQRFAHVGVSRLRCGGCRKRARKFQKRSVVQCQNAVTGKPDFNGLGTRERTTLEGGINPLLDWVSEMSAFVRRLDPNHPIGVGDEGFEPERLLDVPANRFRDVSFVPGLFSGRIGGGFRSAMDSPAHPSGSALLWMIAGAGSDGQPYPDYDRYTVYAAGDVPSVVSFC
jgi:hypothetical protein